MNGVESVDLFEAIITVLTNTSTNTPPPSPTVLPPTDITPINYANCDTSASKNLEASTITTTGTSHANDTVTTVYTSLTLHDKLTWLYCLTKLNRFTLLNGFLSPTIRAQLLTWLECECEYSACDRSGDGLGGVSYIDIIRECIEKYSTQ